MPEWTRRIPYPSATTGCAPCSSVCVESRTAPGQALPAGCWRWRSARLAGYRGVTAFAEFASRLTQKQLAALRAYYSPGYTAPTTTTFHTVLARLPPDTLDWVLRHQMNAGAPPPAMRPVEQVSPGPGSGPGQEQRACDPGPVESRRPHCFPRASRHRAPRWSNRVRPITWPRP